MHQIEYSWSQHPSHELGFHTWGGDQLVAVEPTAGYFELSLAEGEDAMYMQGQSVAAGLPASYFELPMAEGEDATNMQGQPAAAGPPASYFELPTAEGEDAMSVWLSQSAWACTDDPWWATHGEEQSEGWLPFSPYEAMDSPPCLSLSQLLPEPRSTAADQWGPAWSKQGSALPAVSGAPRSGALAPKRRTPMRQGFPCTGQAPLRRACRNKRDRMDAYIEEVAAQLRANPHADISQVDIPWMVRKTPWLQKHAFMAVRELLRGCGRPILDADFLLPETFTAGRRPTRIAHKESASQRPLVPLGPMEML